jgi:6,7-dimethyl-8-ribityllumazine synthase
MVSRSRSESSGRIPGAARFRFGVVVSDYHSETAERLLEGALECLAAHGVSRAATSIFRVPGAFEIAQAAAKLLERPDRPLDALICLGMLLRGETLHFELLAHEVCSSLSELARRTGVPVAFGVLTVDNEGQARDRSGKGRLNKGWEAARAALRMASLYRNLEAGIGSRQARTPGRSAARR